LRLNNKDCSISVIKNGFLIAWTIMNSIWKCLVSVILNVWPFVCINAQSSYPPMLKDGRVWYLKDVYDDHTDTYKYVIQGKETVDGQECYLMYCHRNGNTFGPSRYIEKDRKIYVMDDGGGCKEVFDFSLVAGGNSSLITPLQIISIDTITVCKIDYRCLMFDLWNFYCEQECWIEGIGSVSGGPSWFYDKDIAVPGTFRASVLVSVWDGNECVFDIDEFRNAVNSTGVKCVEGYHDDANQTDNRKHFDLQGRRLANPPVKGVYIRDGKKVVR